MSDFARQIIRWQRHGGRHDLPWQGGDDPYRVWVSEIMLQQTQVLTVVPYFLRFLERFPTVSALAAAPLQSVLETWAGLGYYSRARNLHAAARHIEEHWGGVFPRDPDALLQLPGVGRSTAGAIAALTWGVHAPILDGNVKRVLSRVFGIEGPVDTPAVQKQLWRLAEELLPATGLRAYTQGLMDLGATLCTRTRPRCEVCPVRDVCVARRDARTSELPSPRIRQALPLRTAEWILLRSQDAVLLEERPPRGLWGGLLSLPECAAPRVDDPPPSACEAAVLVTQWLSERFAWQGPPAAFGEQTEVRHSFTHFRLRARVWSLALAGDDKPQARQPPADPASQGEADPAGTPDRGTPGLDTLRWVPLPELARAALPTPVRRLLLGQSRGEVSRGVA